MHQIVLEFEFKELGMHVLQSRCQGLAIVIGDFDWVLPSQHLQGHLLCGTGAT